MVGFVSQDLAWNPSDVRQTYKLLFGHRVCTAAIRNRHGSHEAAAQDEESRFACTHIHRESKERVVFGMVKRERERAGETRLVASSSAS